MLDPASRFDTKRFLRFLALTTAAAAAVLSVGAFQSNVLEPSTVLWQSILIAGLVATGAGWISSESSRRSDVKGDDADAGKLEFRPAAQDDRFTNSSEEQNITVKLLELIALGDRYGNTFSVALLSVDHLADIGRKYNAIAMLRTLKEVHRVLAHTLRMPDRVGEYDHGIYLVVLPETSLPGAIQIAERLRAAVSELDIAVSERIRVGTTASVGVTSYRRGDDLRGLLDRADRALREAQNQGRNRVLPDLAA